MKGFEVKKLGKQAIIEIDVKVTRQFRLRIWAGKQLLKLAAFVMGCGIEINE